MKIIYLSFFVCLFLACTSQPQEETIEESPELTEAIEVVEEDIPQNIDPDLKFLGAHNGFNIYILDSVVTDFGAKITLGTKIDKDITDRLEVSEGITGDASDCHYRMVSFSWELINLGIKSMQVNESESCGYYEDMSFEFTEEERIADIMALEDPRKMASKRVKTSKIVYYSINEEGSFFEDTSVANTTTHQSWVGMSIFDELPKSNLRILRNTIYAKYGYRFNSADLTNYFSEKDWYNPKFDNVDDQITDMDKQVIDYIKVLESKK